MLCAELERRTLRPFEGSVSADDPRLGWLTTTNNWNAVCLAGVTGCALAEIDDSQRRAWFVAAAEDLIQHFLDGFTADGYCSEGIGYWNYGFGHFILLGETVRQATGGEVDFLKRSGVEAMARFGRRIEILPGVYPAFADCRIGTSPDPHWMVYVSRRFQLGLADAEQEGLALAARPGSSLVTFGVLRDASELRDSQPAVAADQPAQPLRDWFSDAGILISRPAQAAHVVWGWR